MSVITKIAKQNVFLTVLHKTKALEFRN